MLLSLKEYDKEWMAWPLQSVSLRLLEAESARWKELLGLREMPFVFRSSRNRRQFEVKARGVTGFLNIGDLNIEVAPKFLLSTSTLSWHAALWHILTLVEENPTTSAPVTAGIPKEDSLPDLLGWILLDSLRQARFIGLPRGYVECEDSLPILRGRFDTSRVAELLITPHRLPCVFDVYAEDIALNRLVRWAAESLSTAVQSPLLSRSLEDEVLGFAGVAAWPPGLIEAENLVLPIQHSHLLPALQVARLLLRRQSLQHQDDEHVAPGFLWKSHDVFERFVLYLLQQVCTRRGWQLVDQCEQDLATPLSPATRAIKTIPDYLILDGSRIILALDAKYKTGNPRSEDVYQVMAAGRINACPHVCLIYPSPSPEAQSRKWRIRGLGNPQKLTALYVDPIQMTSARGEAKIIQQLSDDLGLVLNITTRSN